ncbi:arsenite efflux transporter-like protein ArsB-like protein [Xylariaceae sp. FL0662B]|nr:arsenite efflux transporter-like protein ArsB-like protein [Xylariaceae sp. FL0662B]
MSDELDTNKIKDWRSIVTLIVFVVTNLVVLFPFDIPIYVPRLLSNAVLDSLGALRVIPPREKRPQHGPDGAKDSHVRDGRLLQYFVRFEFPMNFITAPLVADLFLLAILAIGRQEVHDGIVGKDHIVPYDIMIFFFTLAYIAISMDASGLIRFLAFKVLQKGGKVGHKLFFYLYAFFFGLGTFIGNDPIILSGTAFLAYMTRVSSNIIHPRAWIHTQFAVANIASAILVSSNPTNLVLAGAFGIKFVWYTANMIVPVVVTAIVLFPFLLYIVFADESLIPFSIKMHELPEGAIGRKPVNPNIPHARGTAEEEENNANNGQGKLLSLEEIMNPFLDKGGAAFGGIIMTATLVSILVLNAAARNTGQYPVFWVTLPGAFIMLVWDVVFGWLHRHETREIARKGREEIERARVERAIREEEEASQAAREQDERDGIAADGPDSVPVYPSETHQSPSESDTFRSKNDSLGIAKGENQSMTEKNGKGPSGSGDQPPLSRTPHESTNYDGLTPLSSSPSESSVSIAAAKDDRSQDGQIPVSPLTRPDGKRLSADGKPGCFTACPREINEKDRTPSEQEMDLDRRIAQVLALRQERGPATLVSLAADAHRWSQETFPTVMAVLAHLPLALVPFAFCMFILVEALVSKGWVPVFAYGWDHWVTKTGTVGSIGGMGFLSVILCNFAGTNIGTTILLSRVIQAWEMIHQANGTAISDRTFWAAVYGMALGVNYGAFSVAFSASLAGLLWRDILARKHIRVRRIEFARVNLPIIAIAMVVGCAVLVAEVYIFRSNEPYRRDS